MREFIFNNFWWKLLSLVLAALTWLTIQTAFQRDQGLREAPVITESRRSFSAIPITFMTASSNFSAYRVQPATVVLELGGTQAALSKLQEKDIHVYVDVSDAGDERRFRRQVQIRIPDTLEVIRMVPTTVTIERTAIP